MHEIEATQIVFAEFIIAIVFFIAGTIVTRERFQRTQKPSWIERFLFWISRGHIKEDGWKKYVGIATVIGVYLFAMLNFYLLLVKLLGPVAFRVFLGLCFVATDIKLIHQLTKAFIAPGPTQEFVRIAGILLLSGANAAWFLSPNIYLLDIIAGVSLLWLLLATTFNWLSLAFISAIVMWYDYHSVHHTKKMITLAIAAQHSPLAMNFHSFLIGLGDIAIPGLFVMLAWRAAHRFGNGIIYSTITGYMFMFVITMHQVTVQGPQPATIFLLPGAGLPYLIHAWSGRYKGALTERFLKVSLPVFG